MTAGVPTVKGHAGTSSLSRSLREGRRNNVEQIHFSWSVHQAESTRTNIPYEIVKCGPLDSCLELALHFLSEDLAPRTPGPGGLQSGRKGLAERLGPTLIYLIYRLPPEDRKAERGRLCPPRLQGNCSSSSGLRLCAPGPHSSLRLPIPAHTASGLETAQTHPHVHPGARFPTQMAPASSCFQEAAGAAQGNQTAFPPPFPRVRRAARAASPG